MTNPKWLESLRECVTQLEEDAVKFYEKGNAKSGTRMRAILQDVKKLGQEGRAHIQSSKSTLPKVERKQKVAKV